MSAGTLVGAIVTLFGAIAAAAILAAHFVPGLWGSLPGLWMVFIGGFGIGIITALMFCETRSAGLLMHASGVFCLVIALTAGALALGVLLGLVNLESTLHLWTLMVLALPLGVLLTVSGTAAKKRA